MSKPIGAFAWLNAEPGPKMILEALKLFGETEVPGVGSNPTILAWADELGAKVKTAYARWAAQWYDADSIPWCGLFMALVAKRAGKEPPVKFLAAKEWESFGHAPAGEACLGDVLVFDREGGGHVALYVGHDNLRYYCLGGNQGDRVSIIAKDRRTCTAVRRPDYINVPANVRPVFMGPRVPGTPTSTNEA